MTRSNISSAASASDSNSRLYRVGQKSKPDNFFNNFVYCQPIFIICGSCTPYRKFATGGHLFTPHVHCNTVCNRSWWVTYVNSAFHPSEVDKLSSGRSGWGEFTCVGWKVTLCDPIWQVTPRSGEMEFH